MDEEILLKNYTLSECIVERLKIIKEKLKDDIARADPTWEIVVGKKEEELSAHSNESGDDNNTENVSDVFSIVNDAAESQFSSTQFYFTQIDRSKCKESSDPKTQTRNDVVECLSEGLERVNGKLDFGQFENLSDNELNEVVCDLAKRLSVTGVYNLCCSMNCMTLEQQMRYTAVLCSNLLLPKIVAVAEPSRLLSLALAEYVDKFPDAVQKYVFLPLLNVDLKDTTIVNAVANAFQPERNSVLLTEYLSSVNELKPWHIPILQKLTCIKTDRRTNDKLIRLFSEKALEFERNMSFGKLVLSFIKVNNPLLEQQRTVLREVADIHQTLFKESIESILRNEGL